MASLTKSDLASQIQSLTGISAADAKKAAEGLGAYLRLRLLEGGELVINGFGKFTIVEKAERQGRNPRTNEAMTIPAYRTLTFKLSKKFKDELNK